MANKNFKYKTQNPNGQHCPDPKAKSEITADSWTNIGQMPDKVADGLDYFLLMLLAYFWYEYTKNLSEIYVQIK